MRSPNFIRGKYPGSTKAPYLRSGPLRNSERNVVVMVASLGAPLQLRNKVAAFAEDDAYIAKSS